MSFFWFYKLGLIVKERCMMKNYYVVISLFLSLATLVPVQAQVTDAFVSQVVVSVQKGDALDLSSKFSEQVELVLPDKTGVYSRSQAEMILKSFYSTNAPTSFKIMHKGQKEMSSFLIGSYDSKGKMFRMTFLTKESAGKTIIHQLRIEKQDE